MCCQDVFICWGCHKMDHTQGSFNVRSVLTHSSERSRSKTKVLVGSVPSESCEGESVLCSLPGPWSIFGDLWLVEPSPEFCFIFSPCFPHVCVRLSLNFPFYFYLFFFSFSRSGSLLQRTGSLVVARRFSCSTAHEILVP